MRIVLDMILQLQMYIRAKRYLFWLMVFLLRHFELTLLSASDAVLTEIADVLTEIDVLVAAIAVLVTEK
jgi:hypothetical protein